MKYILFIESVKEKEWEVGAIIDNDIKYNPDYKDFRTCYIKIKNSKELRVLLEDYSKVIAAEDNAIVHIDAHLNEMELGFRNDPQIEDSHNVLSWNDVYDMCVSLFKENDDRILFVFASCFSALYFRKMPAPHIRVIAAENAVAPRRMEEQLLVFYKSFCSGKTFEDAYNDMIQKYPIEYELNRDEKEQSILRLYK